MKKGQFSQIVLMSVFLALGFACGGNMEANNASGNRNTNSDAPDTPKNARKNENLFSFPPPQVVDAAEIDRSLLVGAEGATTLSGVSQKLAERLKNAGYLSDRYSYFWNNDNEFAVVTAMERINPDGSPHAISGSQRWTISDNLPGAQNSAEYRDYLINGKKVFYRVFAFIVTSKEYSFDDGTPPSFEMAKNWKKTGKRKIESGKEMVFREVPFDEQYHCYALLYLFVNHTSLDNPKAVNALAGRYEMGLKQDLEQSAAEHLIKAGILEDKK